MLSIRRLEPPFALPSWSPRSGLLLAFGKHLQHLIAVQRRLPHATSGGELASRDQLRDQRHVAAQDLGGLSLVIHTRSTLGGKEPRPAETKATAGSAPSRLRSNATKTASTKLATAAASSTIARSANRTLAGIAVPAAEPVIQ
jgi:hypothetical protein